MSLELRDDYIGHKFPEKKEDSTLCGRRSGVVETECIRTLFQMKGWLK